MNRFARILWLALALAIPASAWALDDKPPEKSSFPVTDQSDLWWNPNESGWGMQVTQQGNILFVTLYVFDANNQPTFFIAGMDPTGTSAWSGDLYQATGPWFGGPFDPATVTGRKVGTITFTAPSVNSGTVHYTVDAVTVTKAVQRELLKYDDYNGNFLTLVNLAITGCTNPANNGTGSLLVGFQIVQNGTAMTIGWKFSDGSTCSHTGTYSQAGRMGQFASTYACTTGEVGTMTLSEVTNRAKMLSGRVQGQSSNIGCIYTGQFTGLNPN